MGLKSQTGTDAQPWNAPSGRKRKPFVCDLAGSEPYPTQERETFSLPPAAGTTADRSADAHRTLTSRERLPAVVLALHPFDLGAQGVLREGREGQPQRWPRESNNDVARLLYEIVRKVERCACGLRGPSRQRSFFARRCLPPRCASLARRCLTRRSFFARRWSSGRLLHGRRDQDVERIFTDGSAQFLGVCHGC